MRFDRLSRWRGPALVLLALVCLCAEAGAQTMVRQDRLFDAPFDRVWDAALKVIQHGGWDILHAEKGKGLIQTRWTEFSEGTFGPSVATKPPRLTWEYGYYHKVKLDSGRSQLKIGIVPSKGGTRVSVSAEIQEYSFHRDLREYNWVERDSNGAIELFFLDRLNESLNGPSTAPDQARTDPGSPGPKH